MILDEKAAAHHSVTITVLSEKARSRGQTVRSERCGADAYTAHNNRLPILRFHYEKRTRVIALMQLRMVARVALELQTFSYFERRLSSGSQLGEKLQ